MLIIPAIDIINGECVRLTKGNFSSKKVYAQDPIRVAKNFEKAGASMLHIVDLDGARTGWPQNMELILRLRKAVKIPIEVGGGIREFRAAAAYLSQGINRIVIGTKAAENSQFLKKLMKKFGREKIIVSIDLREGKLSTEGWQKTSQNDLEIILARLKSLGIEEIIVTDIGRDGMLTKPNFQLLKKIQKLGFTVIAAGGISDLQSIKKLQTMEITGAILGKALYEGKIDLKNTLKFIQARSNLTKRIIPCLDVKNGRVVKGINFKNLRDAGDPVELGKKYSEEGADELVFLDIDASREGRKTMEETVKRVAKEIFIPFTVGGGIKTLDDIRTLLQAGADKVSINTAAVQSPNLISQASKKFGSQCIVVAIDSKKGAVYIKGGTEKTNLNALKWAKKAARLGAGEILLTSMDTDGTQNGFDLPLLQKISNAVKIPVIASGGAGSLKDFKNAFLKGKTDAALAASIFHYETLSIEQVKKYLQSFNIPVRL